VPYHQSDVKTSYTVETEFAFSIQKLCQFTHVLPFRNGICICFKVPVTILVRPLTPLIMCCYVAVCTGDARPQ